MNQARRMCTCQWSGWRPCPLVVHLHDSRPLSVHLHDSRPLSVHQHDSRPLSVHLNDYRATIRRDACVHASDLDGAGDQGRRLWHGAGHVRRAFLQGARSTAHIKTLLRFCPGKMRVGRLEAAKRRRGTEHEVLKSTPSLAFPDETYQVSSLSSVGNDAFGKESGMYGMPFFKVRNRTFKISGQ